MKGISIRFTEFIRYNNKYFSLYFVQKAQEAAELCFNVHLWNGGDAINTMCKKADNIWLIIPKDNSPLPSELNSDEKTIMKNKINLPLIPKFL
jgi:hypothetical protein